MSILILFPRDMSVEERKEGRETVVKEVANL